ncbi:MAG: maleylpyruvate isomerase N-terminal domain-containing protein, partial [Acidimicrobiales bacterium]
MGTPPHRWPGPSPCIGWTARDLVAHVVDFSATVLRERAGVARPPPFADFAEPAAASRATRAAVQSVLEDPATPAKVAGWLDGSLSFDLPQHGWDLAVATGQDATIDAGEAEILWPRSRGRRACGTGSARTAGTDRRCRSPAMRRSSTRVLGLLGRDWCWAPAGDACARVRSGDVPADQRQGAVERDAGNAGAEQGPLAGRGPGDGGQRQGHRHGREGVA